MKSLSLLLLSLIATQAYANLLDGLEHHHGHGDHGHDHAHDHHGEHGDHGHGEHGDHGHEHADHGEHGDHGHGDHGEHGHADHGEHGDHGDHGAHGDHGEHGDHAAGHHDHAEGDQHQHDAHNTVNNDAFANALASDLGGGFLSSNPIPSNDFGAQPSNDLNQGFLQSNPAPTQAPRQNTQAASSQGKQLLGNGELGGPKYNTVPQTSFRCEDQATGGYFADTEADCQVFHICLGGDNLGSFLCPNGTLFHQQFFVCDWWFNVDCNQAPDSYSLNAAIGVVPEQNK